MNSKFDEFSKALAEGVSRREALRRFGGVLAGTILASIGHGTRAQADQKACTAYCKRYAPGKERNNCVKVCNACPSTTKLCGTTGFNVVCCNGTGSVCCNGVCSNSNTDTNNCGTCGHQCGSFPNLITTCENGNCRYTCYDGYADCDKALANGCEVYLGSDPNNCGACGNVCPASAPYCVNSACVPCPDPSLAPCPDGCVDLNSNPNNCGTCGNVCPTEAPYCNNGACDVCPQGQTICDGVCIDTGWDPSNCGGCGVVCDTGAGQVCCYGLCMDYCSCYYCG
jgi:hypothetical protein